jgi:hypothetical protein
MLSGAWIRGYPVRSLLELGNFILSGEVVIRGMSRRMIAGERANGEELRLNLEQDYTRAAVFASMVPIQQEYSLGTTLVTVQTYAIDDDILAHQVGDVASEAGPPAT